MRLIDRRTLLQYGSALAASLALTPASAADGDVESYGLSTFGDLELPADFKHLAYVNPDAPKGGKLALFASDTFNTFDTLNGFVLKGAPAAGIELIFDSLMGGSQDEPDALYGLVAKSVQVSVDKLTYRFTLRPEARFHDGSRITAADAAFSLNVLKDHGHPRFRVPLDEMAEAKAESDDVLLVRFVPTRTRDIHLLVASLPILSAADWKGKDFEASTLTPPLGSGPYKVGKFEQGHYIEFERVADYWGKDLPINIGINNFDLRRYEYFHDRQVGFEAFKSGIVTFDQVHTSRLWHTSFDFPAVTEGKVKKEEVHNGAPSQTQGWYLNTRREQFKDVRVREALGLCFDFEWTNANIMYGSYKRVVSFFQNTPNMAVGKPSPEELALLEPWRGKVPDEVFGDVYVPPVYDGSGNDRDALRQANQLLLQAGCTRDGNVLKLPSGKPFEIEFLETSSLFDAISGPFMSNLKKLGINATSRVVDPSQFKNRTDAFDYDVVVFAMGGVINPGAELRITFSSNAADTPGLENFAGVKDPAVDAMIERAVNAKSKTELNVTCRVLDRLLRAGRYRIHHFYNDKAWLAYWDAYARPDTTPKYGTGAPETWWWDVAKAKQSGVAG